MLKYIKHNYLICPFYRKVFNFDQLIMTSGGNTTQNLSLLENTSLSLHYKLFKLINKTFLPELLSPVTSVNTPRRRPPCKTYNILLCKSNFCYGYYRMVIHEMIASLASPAKQMRKKILDH